MSNLKPVNPAGLDEEFDSLEEGEIIQLVGLKLGDEEYAIDVLKIQEIIRTVEITSVPRTDSFVLGVMNLRGKVIPVVDLRVRFNLDKMDFDKETRIIVVRFDTEHIGFVVDEVTEVIRISKNMVDPTPPLVGSIGQEYILGICKYDDRLIILLDIDTVIAEGKAVAESDLRRRFLGQAAIEAKPVVNYDDVAEAVESEITDEDETGSEEAASDDDSSDDALDSIDDLIAKELAKREQETDELNKKKLTPEFHEAEGDADVEDILKDALSQSDHVVSGDEGHVVQDELDALIAMELAKREKETDDLNRQRKEQEKKNEKLGEEEFNVSSFFADQAAEVAEAEENTAEAVNEEFFGPSMEELLTAQSTTVALDDPETVQTDDIDDILREAESFEVRDEPAAAKFRDEPPAQAVKGMFIEADSLEELKHLSKKIINGDAVDLGIDIKGEIGELLRLILDTKTKVDEVDPTIVMSKESMPVVVQSLEQVNEKTEEATMNLMEAADKMTAFYSQFLNDIEDFEDLVYKKDSKGLLKSIDHIESDISLAENLGFGILHALEFQDITEQKLRKVIKSVEEVGARIGAILGIIKAKKDETGESISGATQDDIDMLLAEFGLN
ncbi:chemotaxis protein CheW [Geovibrio thiophilus]|uniref:Chemotaxis protein CheW n=1 Tax=Geovibrio thiophilus TaxID=139438 RepID=A0A410K127_9BACT|nr:chemotaxis protein CheW [Geovibrio thiophilus]QAR34130.1 chemotaxis protein CheW [Geovibrio thiophilus]